MDIREEQRYLIKALRNTAKNHIRDNIRSRELFESLSLYHELGDDSQDPERIYLYKELYQAIESLIKEVPNSNHREVLMEYFLNGLTVNEIAEEMEISSGNVRIIIMRFRNKIDME
jgi:RNA polymerase sigma factor (sigma-70 family)